MSKTKRNKHVTVAALLIQAMESGDPMAIAGAIAVLGRITLELEGKLRSLCELMEAKGVLTAEDAEEYFGAVCTEGQQQ